MLLRRAVARIRTKNFAMSRHPGSQAEPRRGLPGQNQFAVGPIRHRDWSDLWQSTHRPVRQIDAHLPLVPQTAPPDLAAPARKDWLIGVPSRRYALARGGFVREPAHDSSPSK